jgi:FixJ family two-component response regulator
MAKRPAPGPRCIAVVEDDDGVRASIRDLLSSAGLTSRSFRTAEGFLRSGILRRVACLIVDEQLPGMSGLALRERLRRDAVAIPMVIISANYGRGPRSRPRESPRDGTAFFSKPFDTRRLLRAIRTALRTDTKG